MLGALLGQLTQSVPRSLNYSPLSMLSAITGQLTQSVSRPLNYSPLSILSALLDQLLVPNLYYFY